MDYSDTDNGAKSASRPPNLDFSSLGDAELAAIKAVLEAAADSRAEDEDTLLALDELKAALTQAQSYCPESDSDEKLLGTALLGEEVPCEMGISILGGCDESEPEEYRVLAIDFGGALSKKEIQKLRAQVAAAVPMSKVVALDNVIALVAKGRSLPIDDAPIDKIQVVAKLNGLPCHIGASDTTRYFELLAVCFDHARFAAELAAQKDVPLISHDQCAFEYFLSKSNVIENFPYLRDMRALKLYESDNDKGSDLLNTVINYIECGFDLGRTASQMHLHRNSVVYRLNRIAERSGIDLLGPIERIDVANLLITCKVYRSKLDTNAVPPEWVPSC